MKVKLTADSSLALIVISFSSVVTDVKGFKYLYVTSFEPETTFSVPFGFVSLIVAVYVTVPALYGT